MDRDTHLKHLLTAFVAISLFFLITWMIYLGQEVLVPLAYAVVAAFVLVQVVDWLGRLPIIGRTPLWSRHVVVLAAFLIAVAVLVVQVRINVEALIGRLPDYQVNISLLLDRVDARFGLDQYWDGGLSRALLSQFNPQAIARSFLGALGSLGGLVLLIFLYTAFVLAEYANFVGKLHTALGDSRDVEQALRVTGDINQRIGGFLAIKTVVNLFLGIISYAALVVLGIELAGFWAIVIGVLNYIPYLGSFAAVSFPVVMALAQSGSIRVAATTLVVLTILQVIVGSFVEPRMIGQRVNLSPLVVLISLAGWYALWGFSGAVLAIPLTVILLSVLSTMEFTRPLAILLSNNGRV
ncbi:MAG: AI-2E family transporter [Celeribacter sp.]